MRCRLLPLLLLAAFPTQALASAITIDLVSTQDVVDYSINNHLTDKRGGTFWIPGVTGKQPASDKASTTTPAVASASATYAIGDTGFTVNASLVRPDPAGAYAQIDDLFSFTANTNLSYSLASLLTDSAGAGLISQFVELNDTTTNTILYEGGVQGPGTLATQIALDQPAPPGFTLTSANFSPPVTSILGSLTGQINAGDTINFSAALIIQNSSSSSDAGASATGNASLLLTPAPLITPLPPALASTLLLLPLLLLPTLRRPKPL